MPGTRVNAILINAANQFRKVKTEVEPEFPSYLLNRKDKTPHAYYLHNRPIYVEKKPIHLNTFEELLTVTPPATPRLAEKFIYVGEDGFDYGISTEGIPDLQTQKHHRQEAREEARQMANIRVIREERATALQMLWAWAVLSIVGIGAMVVILFALQATVLGGGA
jgi:hypothetical protein